MSGSGDEECDNFLKIDRLYQTYFIEDLKPIKVEQNDSSTREPQSLESKNRKFLRPRMRGTWQEDPYFLNKHFISNYQSKKYAKITMDTHYTSKIGRWKRIPASPTSTDQLVLALQSLLNTILAKANIPQNRRIWLRPNSSTLKVCRHPLPAPSLFLAGAGEAFLASSNGKPLPEYSSCIVPVQIMLERDYTATKRHLSAALANEVFSAQDNRRYIYVAIMTETYLRIFMFDSSGGVVAPALPYHSRPADLCAVIAGLATLDEARAGFDTSIALNEYMKPTISTREISEDGSLRKVTYAIKERLFKASKFIGRATTCWLVASVEEDSRLYVIKDAWVALSQTQNEIEGSLIDYARQKGVHRGLVRVRHQARLTVPGRTEDTIIKNRRIRTGVLTTEYNIVQDRVHTRIVMETCGKPIWHFSSRRELLTAFYDAVQAHQNLHQVAGVLHRDISMNNMLINIDPNAEEGDRGLLIDLDFAVRLEKQSSDPMNVGTTRFMAYSILERRRVHTYLDDLESFYYVLCWLICTHNGPRNSRVETPEELKELDAKDRGMPKLAHLQKPFSLPVQPWFGPAIHNLAVRLHDYFQRYCAAISFEMDPDSDYSEFLGYIKDAIDGLEPEGDVDVISKEKSKLAPIENQATSFFRKRNAKEKGNDEDEDEDKPPAKRPAWTIRVSTPDPPRRSKRLSKARKTTRKRKK